MLFGETQGRIVVSCPALEAVKLVERAKLLGVQAVRIGTVGGGSLKIRASGKEFSWCLTELYDLWWNSIARAMR
jgi:hypothetical protein